MSLIVAVNPINLYNSCKQLGVFAARGEIEQLILAEFGAASLLIAAGAILGRLRMYQQKFHNIIDTCGVSNLHGIPGVFGGLAAIVVVKGIDITAQLKGIAITVILAIVASLLSGKLISLFGKRKEIYDDLAEIYNAD